jgi:hypothetical protein
VRAADNARSPRIIAAVLSRLIARLRRRREPVPLVLYTRRRCTLCDRMRVEIARARLGRRVRLELVDVDLDPELARRYGARVPVLAIGGRVAFEGTLTAADLERDFARLAAEWEHVRTFPRALGVRG